MAQAMNFLGAMEPYDVKSNSWASYMKRMDQFFLANGLPTDPGEDQQAEARQRAIFLTLIGQEAFDILESLLTPREPSETKLADIRKALKNHFAPVPLEIAETVRFRRRYQSETETAAQYLAALRHHAKHCAFPNLERALRDQFVTGLRNLATQQKLLGTKDLTLANALQIATSMEAAKKQAPTLRSGGSSSEVSKEIGNLTARGKLPRGSSKSSQPCFRCGIKGHSPDDCWHKNKMCTICKKKRLGSRLQNEAEIAVPAEAPIQAKRQVAIEEVDDTDEDEFYLNAINSVKGDTSRITVTPIINGKAITMEVDTGAAVSIISRKTWTENFKEYPLTTANVVLTTYSNEKLEVLGQSSMTVELDGQKATLPIIVVGGDGPALLGRNWLHAIRLDWKGLKIARVMSADPQATELIKSYKELFGDDLGTVKGFKASLKLQPGATPTFLKARPAVYSLRDGIGQELDRLEKKGVLQKVSTSRWATPLVVVTKPDKSLRLCGDFKVTVNKVLDVDQYPLPKPDDLFATLAGGEKFTKMDLASAYLQVELDEGSREIVTLNTHQGLYRPVQMPFGIANAPAIFQNIMDQVLHGLKGVVCYLDDILVTGKDDKEHLENLKATFERLQQHGIRLKRTKCAFMADAIEYLGYLVDCTGLHTTEKKQAAIEKAPRPVNVKQLRSFLGLVNYYGKFIPDLSTTEKPLNELLKKDTPLEMDGRV
eukprot:m.294194 g.294194  ORF g.294194 m.294194 type:complete len:713 (+) comp40742_c0_seq74:392-2530(+)